jgi:methylglutaconyl-CoA hydratase
MMKYIKVENLTSDVKVVTLNRPEVKNAFHPEMIAEITAFFNGENQSDTSRLIILRGEGSAFCAGADLNWMKDMVNFSLDENKTDSIRLWNMFEAVQSCRIPVIAVAHGAVFGGALGLLVACDYVVAEEKTQFCFSEVKLGLAPAIISGFISQKIQDAFFRPLMISGEVFNTSAAQKMGIVHQSFSQSIDSAEIVKQFAANGTEAMKETKKLLNALLANSEREVRKNLCTQVISERRVSNEGQERLKKFLNK